MTNAVPSTYRFDKCSANPKGQEDNLSEKIYYEGLKNNSVIDVKDVREAVEKLKDNLLAQTQTDFVTDRYEIGIQAGCIFAIQQINEIFGEDLI